MCKTVKGYTILKAGYPEIAISTLTSPAEKKLEYFDPRLYLGVAYESIDEDDKAKSIMQEALSLNSVHPVVYQVLGKVGFKEGDLNEFTSNYEAAISYAPTSQKEEFRREFADRLIAKNLYTTAEKVYTDLIKENPKGETLKELEYRNKLASMLVMKSKEYAKALEFSETFSNSTQFKELKDKEEKAKLLAYVCGAKIHLGERVEGVKICDEALELDKYSEIAYFYKGFSKYELKEDSEAKTLLQTAVDLDITGEVSEQAEKLLSEL